MPHLIGFDEVEQKLFVLKHLCYGSREACERWRIGRYTEEIGEFEWWEYFGLLKSTVSATVIEAAIKLRMIRDFIAVEDMEVDLSALDGNALEGLRIGEFCKGGGELTLRESCNKIIHATEARLNWSELDHERELEYWNGGYGLWGAQRGEKWHVQLWVPDWCTAMIRFNKAVQESVDWMSIAKWDE